MEIILTHIISGQIWAKFKATRKNYFLENVGQTTLSSII